jgi:hypothetical protein
MNEATLYAKTACGNSVVQVTSEKMFVEVPCLLLDGSPPASQTKAGTSETVDTGVRIKGLAVSERYVIVWNGRVVDVREIKATG